MSIHFNLVASLRPLHSTRSGYECGKGEGNVQRRVQDSCHGEGIRLAQLASPERERKLSAAGAGEAHLPELSRLS